MPGGVLHRVRDRDHSDGDGRHTSRAGQPRRCLTLAKSNTTWARLTKKYTEVRGGVLSVSRFKRVAW